MALFHLNVKQIKRSQGQSAIASAAYRAGEKLSSEYYGEIADYTHKGGVICSEILLPDHVSREYADRETLWNAVEKVERGKNAQLAYSFDVALQNEFSMDENIALARHFVKRFHNTGGFVQAVPTGTEQAGVPHRRFICQQHTCVGQHTHHPEWSVFIRQRTATAACTAVAVLAIYPAI